jgi:hypothetical protein
MRDNTVSRVTAAAPPISRLAPELHLEIIFHLLNTKVPRDYVLSIDIWSGPNSYLGISRCPLEPLLDEANHVLESYLRAVPFARLCWEANKRVILRLVAKSRLAVLRPYIKELQGVRERAGDMHLSWTIRTMRQCEPFPRLLRHRSLLLEFRIRKTDVIIAGLEDRVEELEGFL